MHRNKLYPEWLKDLLKLLEGLANSKKCKPIVRQHRRIGRNERCRCGCGKKYGHHLWASDVQRGIR